MAKIYKVILTLNNTYVYFDGPEPEIGNFNVKYGSLRVIIPFILKFGALEIQIETRLSPELTLKTIKQICKKCGYKYNEDFNLSK